MENVKFVRIFCDSGLVNIKKPLVHSEFLTVVALKPGREKKYASLNSFVLVHRPQGFWWDGGLENGDRRKNPRGRAPLGAINCHCCWLSGLQFIETNGQTFSVSIFSTRAYFFIRIRIAVFFTRIKVKRELKMTSWAKPVSTGDRHFKPCTLIARL